MAGTKIDICNGALIRIGERPISSLDDGTDTSDLCKNRFEIARRKVIRSHPWKRARRRAILAPSLDTPDFQWSKQFPIPGDCLRIWLVCDENGDPINEWEFESNLILSDENLIYLKYITDFQEVSLLDDSINEVIALQLATELSYVRSGDEQATRRIMEEYRMRFAEAKSIDAKEDYQKTIQATEWVDAQTLGVQPTKYPNLA